MGQRSSNIIKALELEIMNGKLTTVERFSSREKLCDRFVASRTVNFPDISPLPIEKMVEFH